MPLSLNEIHTQTPDDPDKPSWGWTFPFKDAATAGNDLHLQDDPLTYLDGLLESDHDRAFKINSALLYLPADAVLENYGEEVGVWATTNSIASGDSDALKTELKDRGYSLSDIEIAAHWEWRNRYKTFGRNILKQYATMNAITSNNVLEDIDLEKVLAESANEGVELSQRRLGHYALIPLQVGKNLNSYYTGGPVEGWSEDVRPDLHYSMWLDTPVGFALTYKGLPNAMAGHAANGTDELMAYQLQGVKGYRVDPEKSRYDEARLQGVVKARGLAPIDWKKAMVGVSELLAHKLGFESAGIQSAQNNVWTKKRLSRDTEPHLPLPTAIRTYDETAIRLGYTASPADEKHNWHKSI